MTIQELQAYIHKKSFNTRGLPLTKKLWRDGYNKALDDLINYLLMQEQES